MKRLFAVVILLCLLFNVGLAEELDLTGMRLEELAALQTRVEIEIGTRFGEGWVKLGAGSYVAGKGIQAGSYEIICVYGNDMTGFCMLKFDNEDDANKSTSATWFSFLNEPGAVISVHLDEGQALVVSGGNGIVRKAPSFFMP